MSENIKNRMMNNSNYTNNWKLYFNGFYLTVENIEKSI